MHPCRVCVCVKMSEKRKGKDLRGHCTTLFYVMKTSNHRSVLNGYIMVLEAKYLLHLLPNRKKITFLRAPHGLFSNNLFTKQLQSF